MVDSPVMGAGNGVTGGGASPLRVVVADDSYLVREAVEHVLAEADDIRVVASCADLPALRYAVEEQKPDVVLTDIRMPPGHSDEGLRVAAELRRSHPGVGVVVLSQYAGPAYGLALFEAGPTGARTCSRSACSTAGSSWPPSARSPPADRWSTPRSSRG